jgi:hypothetical protein
MLDKIDGPIPGENYTSDTKNYPWHRPPEITDYDEAIEYMITHLTDPEVGYTYMPLFEAGYTVATAADIFVTEGIAEGKWTPDYALLLAGPTARMLQILARSMGMEPEMGVDKPLDIVDPEFLATIRDGSMANPEGDPLAEEGMDDTDPTQDPMAGGLMAAPGVATADEQMEMLGYGAPDENAPQEEIL